MALFPASPSNGQTANVNGISYVYNSAQAAWVRSSSATSTDLTVTGNGTFSGNITASYITGIVSSAETVTTAAQPNITSVGTLTSLTANGNVTINQTAAQIMTVKAAQPPTSDMVVITNTGQNVATANVNALNVQYIGGTGAIESSAIRSDMTPGTTSGSTWNAFRVAATTAAASGVTFNGIKFDSKSTGAGTSRAFYVGTGYDQILNYNGTTVINGNGTIVGSQVSGAVSSATSATTAGTVTTAAQPNITSVGTLTGLTLSGLAVGATSAATDVNTANDTGSFSIRGSTTTVASISFHRPNAGAINMGLGVDNIFRIGGWSASNNAFQMNYSGDLTMLGNVTAYSDERLKTDIAKIENAIQKVKAISGYTYTRTDTGSKGLGVLAQEVKKVLPEVVMGTEDTYYSVAYGNMVGLLIEAIKEQQEQIDKLQAEVDTLKGK